MILFGVVAVATFVSFRVPQQATPNSQPSAQSEDLASRIDVNSPLDPNLGVQDPAALKDLNLRDQKDHPVDPKMQEAADGLEGRIAPAFELPDETGTMRSLASFIGDRPALLFFIEKDCPCCLGAKHFMERLGSMYRGHLSVIGIINASGKTAESWRRVTRPKFPVLEDPQQRVIRQYDAERGVYTTLVRPDGVIEKAYPGYSKDVLDEMSRRIARLAGVEYQPYRSIAAPDRLTSGCAFPDPEPAP